MESHIKLVAILYLVLSILGLLTALVIHFILNLVGLIADDGQASFILAIISNVISTILFISSIPGIIGAWGLWKGKEWARILIVVLSVFNLVNFPFGTAVGIYALWTLLQPESLVWFNKDSQGNERT